MATVTPSTVAATTRVGVVDGVPVLFWNRAEGGSDGTTVTAGNSGGASGSPISSVNGSLITFEADAAMEGSLGYRVASGTGSTGYFDITLLSGIALSLQLYLKWQADPGSEQRVIAFRNASTVGGLVMESTGSVRVMQGTSSIVGADSGALVTGDAYLVNLAIKNGTGGTGTYKLQVLDPSDWSEVYYGSGAFTGPNSSNITTVRIGRQLVSTDFGGWLDFDGIRIAVSDEVLPPPSIDQYLSPAAVAAAATVGTATLGAGATPTPGVVAATASVPAPTVSAATSASVSASTVAGSSSVGAATAGGGATATPSAVAGTVSVGAPSLSAGVAVAAGGVAAAASVPAPSVAVGVTAAVSAVSATASVGAPSTSGGATAIPTVLVGVAAIGSPTVAVAGNASVSAATVAAAASAPAPTVSGGATVGAERVEAYSYVDSATVTAAAAISAATVAAAVSVPTPTVLTGVVIPAAVVAGAASVGVPAPSASSTVAAVRVLAAATIGSAMVGGAVAEVFNGSAWVGAHVWNGTEWRDDAEIMAASGWIPFKVAALPDMPTWVTGATTYTNSGAGSLTIPIAVDAGDLGILVAGYDSGTDPVWAAPAGWTLVTHFAATNSHWYIWTRVMDGTELTIASPWSVGAGTLHGGWWRNAALGAVGTPGIRSGTVFTVAAPNVATTNPKALLFGDRSIMSAAGETDAINSLSPYGQVRHAGAINVLSQGTGICSAYFADGTGSGDVTATMQDASGNAFGMQLELVPA